MSLLWRLLRQIASWLDECPEVRVEHVSPAAKQEQIKGQRNPFELEERFACTRPLFRQCFTGRRSAWKLDRGVISLWTLSRDLDFQDFIETLIHKTHNHEQKQRTQEKLEKSKSPNKNCRYCKCISIEVEVGSNVRWLNKQGMWWPVNVTTTDKCGIRNALESGRIQI